MLHPDIERVALLGWHLYPQSRTSRHGRFKGAADAATCDLDTLEGWARQYPGCNWRVVFGPSGLWGLDCDVPGEQHTHDGVANFRAWLAGRELPPRPTARSGGGGTLVFFQHKGERIIGQSGHPVPGVDPRRGRQSQTIPPSVHHATRQPYRWLVAPWEVSPPVAPGFLTEALQPPPEPPERASPPSDPAKRSAYAEAALHRATREVAAAVNGARNDTLNRAAFSLARFVHDGTLGTSDLRDALMAAARANGMAADDGHRAALLTIDSGLRARARAG